MKYFAIIILSLVFITSCDSIKNPTLEGIRNVEIEEINTKKLVVRAEMIINNSNPFSLELEEADMYAIVEDIELARINQTIGTEMPAKQDFRMPVLIDMDLTKLYEDDPLGAISKGLKIMNDKKLDVLFRGEIKIGKGKAKISVPIDQVETVTF